MPHEDSRAQPQSGGPGVDAVWAREEAYWRFVQAGDAEGYLTLWDDSFRGWPCAEQHPVAKDAVTGWVREVRDRKLRLSYKLTREAAVDCGDIIVVYYRTPVVLEYPDGHSVNRRRIFKFTHTWRRSGGAWLIVGGMCGEVPPAARRRTTERRP